MEILSNKLLTIKVSPEGAELHSIQSNHNSQEYLWQADPKFWKRHSPILFPIVGSLWNNKYSHNGISFPMSQHGFARDKQFELIETSPDKLSYRFASTPDTIKVYPFHFILEIGYQLTGNQIKVQWSVKNTGKEKMYFQIGAHPAFYYPDFRDNTTNRGYFSFNVKDKFEYILISEKGCVSTQKHVMKLTDGLLPIDIHSFDKDAFIIENKQINSVSLLDKDKNPYITLQFTAPVVELWSPPAQNAPFVCIEPWFGRCDQAGYSGEYKDKDWMQILAPDEIFNTGYTIIIENA